VIALSSKNIIKNVNSVEKTGTFHNLRSFQNTVKKIKTKTSSKPNASLPCKALLYDKLLSVTAIFEQV
jgi:hypothetical protein